MIYDRPHDAMLASAREWLGLALLGASHEREFQKRLSDACNAETISFDDAMMLGHAAMMIADDSECQTFTAWYRQQATMLFCRAFDAVALERETRTATDAGWVQ